VPSAINLAAEQCDAACNDRRSSSFSDQTPKTGTAAATDRGVCSAVWFNASACRANSRDTSWRRANSGRAIGRHCCTVSGAKSHARASRNAVYNCHGRFANSGWRYFD
jgi:hypothetical protein